MAADVLDPAVISWGVGLLLSGGVTALGFLLRSALGKVETGIEGLGGKLDAMVKEMGNAAVHAAGFESDVRGEIRALRDRLDRLERDVREASEGAGR